RKQVERELKKSLQLLRDAGAMANIGGWELDVATQDQVWTEEVYRIHEVDINYKPTATKGIDFYASTSRPIIELAVQRAIEYGESFDLELEIITAKGNLRWVHAVGKADQEHGKILGVFQNITERKRAEEQIRLNETRLISLLNIMQHRSETTQEFLDYALQEAIQLTQSKIGYIYLYHEDRRQFVLNAWSKDVMKECSITNPQTCYELERTGVWGEAVRQSKPIILNDFQAPHPLRKGYPEGHAHLSKFATVPVRKDDKIVAVVGVANKENDYDEGDVLQLTLLMDTVWKSLDIKQAEEALRKSEERFKQLAEVFPETIFEANLKGDVTYANEHGLKHFGLTEEDIAKGVNIFDMVSPRDRNLTQERIQSRIKGSEERYLEYKAMKKDGSIFDALALSVPIIVDGIPVGIRGFILDITKRKQMEEALRKNDLFLNTLLNSIPIPVFYKDRDGRYTGFNRAFENFFGTTKERLVGKTVFDINPPELAKIYHAKDNEIFEGGNAQYYESQVKNALGATRNVVFNKAALTDSQGKVSGLIGAILDITERKQGEVALRRSEARLQTITNSAHDAIVMIDNNGNISFWNPAAEHILGYTSTEAMGKNLHKWIVPERFLAAHLAAFPEFQKTGRGGAIGKTLELVARRKDGREIDVEVSLSAVKIEGSWHAVGIMQDITERKQAERTLKETRDYLDNLITYANAPIITWSPDFTITRFNQAFEHLSGRKAEDALGKKLEILFPKKSKEESLSRIRMALAGEFWESVEIPILCKDGTIRIALWNSANIYGVDGKTLVSTIAQGYDITERKQAEEQIKHLATHDLLTDLPSLRLAKDRLNMAINMARRNKTSMAVMFIDLDGFKAVNDTLGHDAGDYMLQQVARRLLACVRETDTVARVGGDEFLIIATEINSPENVAQIAEKVIQLVSQPVMIKKQQAVVGASIGIALFPGDGKDMDQLIKQADEAMYKVKNAGKNGFCFVKSCNKTTIKQSKTN
ncbi:MAG: PAS domain S-box protein, partial [Smithella sp.]